MHVWCTFRNIDITRWRVDVKCRATRLLGIELTNLFIPLKNFIRSLKWSLLSSSTDVENGGYYALESTHVATCTHPFRLWVWGGREVSEPPTPGEHHGLKCATRLPDR
jgi:hypothetical protein